MIFYVIEQIIHAFNINVSLYLLMTLFISLEMWDTVSQNVMSCPVPVSLFH